MALSVPDSLLVLARAGAGSRVLVRKSMPGSVSRRLS